MADSTDTSDLKIVDFGLSKIIGPNETSLDPFGTLVSLYITLIFYNSHMLLQKCYYKNHMAKRLICGVLV
jgi:hypothetical protein